MENTGQTLKIWEIFRRIANFFFINTHIAYIESLFMNILLYFLLLSWENLFTYDKWIDTWNCVCCIEYLKKKYFSQFSCIEKTSATPLFTHTFKKTNEKKLFVLWGKRSPGCLKSKRLTMLLIKINPITFFSTHTIKTILSIPHNMSKSTTSFRLFRET